MTKLNPYQLLFFNREINFGHASSNVLKGYADIKGADYEKLFESIKIVIEKSEWSYLSIDKNLNSWVINSSLNGRLEKFSFDPDISIDQHLWSVQLIKDENSEKIRLHLYLHHCLADAHSFNLFWESVFNQYQNESFDIAPLFPELSYSQVDLHAKQKVLVTDLGIGTIQRISVKFNSRIKNHLNRLADRQNTSLMAMLLQYIEDELNTCEKDIELPLKLGIALRNRKNKSQKKAFPTLVNFLPLEDDSELSIQQRIMKLFRYQDYPLINYLNDNSLPIAFNVLFSYQKEFYLVEDGFQSKFTFEASSCDDNILGVHLLEYDDNSLMLHLDYRTDIASEEYWNSTLRKVTRRVIADYLKCSDKRVIKTPAVLYPNTTYTADFWDLFDQVSPNKIALICNNQILNFGEIKEKIKSFRFPKELKLKHLKPERTAENIIELLAAWKNGLAVTYHEIDAKTEKYQTAYVAKSSGTSGEQKTIHISFEGLSSLIPDWRKVYSTNESVHLCLADQRFDVFFGDVLRSIISGETMLLATEDERLDANEIDRLIKDYNVSHFESTPSFLSYLLPALNDLSGIKVIICGSESIQRGFYNSLKRNKYNHIAFFNSYGLTECSIDSTVAKLNMDKEGRFPSGFPIGDQIISIRDTKMAHKPPGIWGEVCIEGSCVGVQSNNYARTNLFKTGDRGMITKNGLILNGRINEDFIKINGRRVPSNSIEQVTSSINGVNNCLCIEVQKTAVLFVHGVPEVETIRKKLSKVLSRYQQPDDFFICKDWPINQNGKADRKKLIQAYIEKSLNKKTWKPSDNYKDKILFECLSERKKSFGDVDDSLISFGWNSIELLSLANELNLKGIFVPLASFIQNPSIRFVLNSSIQTQNVTNVENPEAEDFDIDDILSVLNE